MRRYLPDSDRENEIGVANLARWTRWPSLGFVHKFAFPNLEIPIRDTDGMKTVYLAAGGPWRPPSNLLR